MGHNRKEGRIFAWGKQLRQMGKNATMKWLMVVVAMLFARNAVAQETEPAYTEVGGDTVCQIFVYSPDERQGLHVAWLDENGSWRHVGQLCGSDYSTWGVEKRMYDPYVTHAEDGTWRLVFSVNDHAPCLAASYSEDLITWRPQDYPRMSAKGCKEPIVFGMSDGTFDIYYKTADGQKRYVKASADFRHFEEDSIPSTIDDVAWLRDTATVDGRLVQGNLFDVPKVHLDYIRQWFVALDNDARLNGESMNDDSQRFASLPSVVNATLHVDPSAPKTISDKLMGVFFEDISYAADGGLYAELIQNRDFEYKPGEGREKGWGPLFAWQMSKGVKLATDEPLSANNPNHVVMEADTLWNEGWDGIVDSYDGPYDFSFYVRNIDCQKKQFLVQLVDENGGVVAEAKVKTEGEGWKRYALPLEYTNKKWMKVAVAEDKKCRLRIIAQKQGKVALDMISLFPRETFKGHGLRVDLAEAIAALKPKFVRFPGGCMSHGQGIENIYHWNHTVGPWQDRKPDFNIWNYHQTRGLGFYEFFQFCEDIGAEPLPVLAAGVPCQNSSPNKDGIGGQQGGIAMEDMPAYVDELCHLIEWANADPATNKWAKMRADAGHPAPFNLKYIGIGNEDIISTVFEERCEMICRTIKERHPEITICGTVGPFHYPSADYVEGWDFAKKHKDVIDMVDEHYYESTGWFMHHQDYYDNYDRTAPKVYVGEWASRTRTHESALAEALFLCGLERNGDVVEMSSYAPLLAKEGHHNWNPDLIYFDNTRVTLTPSYHTQRLWGQFGGDRYMPSRLEMAQPELAYRIGASVVKDSRTGKTYLKLVNALPSSVKLDVKGLSLPAYPLWEGFSGRPADTKVNVRIPDDDHSGERLVIDGQTITLPPYSVRVVEL